jgi:hypothetical protein
VFILSSKVLVLTTDFNWRFELEQDRLRDEDFSGFVANLLDFILSELNWLAWFTAPHFEQPVNNVVDVEVGHI